MAADPAERAYKARALAQAHPLTPVARRFRERAVAQEEIDQPMKELARWAGEALLKGYCLRKVEEQLAADVTGSLAPAPEASMNVEEVDFDALGQRATEVAADLRAGDPAPHLLDAPTLTFEALDRIITSELSSRSDNYRGAVDEAGWREFEEYIAWWAVRGYALRVAETSLGATA